MLDVTSSTPAVARTSAPVTATDWPDSARLEPGTPETVGVAAPVGLDRVRAPVVVIARLGRVAATPIVVAGETWSPRKAVCNASGAAPTSSAPWPWKKTPLGAARATPPAAP